MSAIPVAKEYAYQVQPFPWKAGFRLHESYTVSLFAHCILASTERVLLTIINAYSL